LRAAGNTDSPAVAEEEATPETPEEMLMIEPIWMRPFFAYLTQQELPEDPTEAQQIVHRSKAYTMINEKL
jgi:hypothetical protein